MPNLTLANVETANIAPSQKANGYLDVEIEGAEIEDLLGSLSLEEIADYFGDELVEFIKDNNNLVEAE